MNVHSRLPLKLVLDTNVALDWIVFEDAAVVPIRDAIDAGWVIVATDARAIEELRDVMARERFALSPQRQAQLMDRYLAQTLPPTDSEHPALPENFPQCSDDPDDDCFLALAWRCGAGMLLSRDKAVLALDRRCAPFGFRVLSIDRGIAEIERLSRP